MTNFSSLVMPLRRARELETCFIVVMRAPLSLPGGRLPMLLQKCQYLTTTIPNKYISYCFHCCFYVIFYGQHYRLCDKLPLAVHGTSLKMITQGTEWTSKRY